MSTGTELMTAALRIVGATPTGEPSDANDLLEALDEANRMLQQWSLEDLMLYYSKIDSLPLIAGQIVYEIGPTGFDLVMELPVEILSYTFRDSLGFDRPMGNISYEEYQRYIEKSSVTNNYPAAAAYQATIPNGNLYIWPSPISGTLRILSNKLFSVITDEGVDLLLPIGGDDCFVYGLVERLCLKYGKSELLSEYRQQALRARMNLKRKNTKKTTMQIDNAFLQRRNGTYNQYTDR